MSGFGIAQPSVNWTGLGASFGSPAGAPASTHATSVCFADSGSVRSFAQVPVCGSANHGGIFLVRTAVFIAFAHGRVESYVRNDIGAASPGRWHSWHLFCKMGRTSR